MRVLQTHARVGILPGWGLSQRLSRLLGRRVPRRYRSPAILSMRSSLCLGVINTIVPRDQLLARAFELADDMLSCLPDALVQYKALIDDGYVPILVKA